MSSHLRALFFELKTKEYLILCYAIGIRPLRLMLLELVHPMLRRKKQEACPSFCTSALKGFPSNGPASGPVGRKLNPVRPCGNRMRFPQGRTIYSRPAHDQEALNIPAANR